MIGTCREMVRSVALFSLMGAAISFCAATSLLAQAPQNAQSSQGSDNAQSTQTPKTPAESARKDLLTQFNDALQELTARVSPAIVQVQVTGYRALNDKSQDDTSMIGRERSLGSGVIVDPDGYIITNAHVVKGAQRVRVVLTPTTAGDSQVRASLGLGEHSPPIDARIIGIAPTIDLALLKVEEKNLPAIGFADYTQLKKGELVLALWKSRGAGKFGDVGSGECRRAAGRPGRAVGVHTDGCADQSGK